jgi:hypothetical protein
MEFLLQFCTLTVGAVSGHLNLLFASLPDWGAILPVVGGLSLAFAPWTATFANIPNGVLASTRRWHGSIDDRFNNIDNLVNILKDNQTKWSVPQEMLQQLSDGHDRLVAKCRSNHNSVADRTVRNSLLKTTVSLCLTQTKVWAYTQYYAGTLTIDDVHLFDFYVPGETDGHRDRRESTNVPAEVKVSVINMDNIHVVIDQAAGKNAALATHGWPPGVHQAVIVIMAADDITEVSRLFTTRLHNDIRMPEGSHGKLFIIKAAFLRHISDEPKFGPEPTFSMPLTTEDLTVAADRRQCEIFEAQQREIKRLRLTVERLRAGNTFRG